MEEAAAGLIHEYGVKLVFVTMGKDGCYFVNPVASGVLPTFTDVKTVDTTGAVSYTHLDVYKRQVPSFRIPKGDAVVIASDPAL